MCHIKRRTYVDELGKRHINRTRYVCEFHKQGRPCSTTSEDEGEITTQEVRPATSSGHPSRDGTVVVDESSRMASRHHGRKSRLPIGTLFLETIGARSKTKKPKSHPRHQREPIEVVIDQPETPVAPLEPPFNEGGRFERPRQPPPPPTHHPPTSRNTSEPVHIEIVSPPRSRRRRVTVVHDDRPEHTPVPPAESSRLDRLHRGGTEYQRPRRDSVLRTPTSGSPRSPTFSGTDDTEFFDRARAREEARRQKSDEVRRQNEEDRRHEREAEERRQAQLDRQRNLYREERRRSREAAERRRRLEETEEQERIERADRERLKRRERQRREDERLRRRAARESEDLRQRYRYEEPEAFPNYYGTARAPPQASPRQPRVDVSYGEQHPSMRYPQPPSPRNPPRTLHHRPTDRYDERHATYYSEGQPGTRIQQHTSTWWPSTHGIFRRNTYSGGYPVYRDRNGERARRRAMFWAD
ncbi:hypothetical protein EV356DRAFT_530488 [Viridothelium virens]|uniref:Uncharacterized protein n=1 Tax=Viridothelium virens TaxID=1048519 RepID=A0A6A6HGK9_VIRVR|nr:hypothetical protein EV356DRAFT_530488 [Viridothelium virens]